MTFVGKILVILIMAFSLVFLGVSVVTFTTANNWKEKTNALTKDIQQVRTQLSSAQEESKNAQTKLDVATKEHDTNVKEKSTRIAELEAQIKAASEETLRAQSSLETAQANAKTALEEATARKAQIDTLNATIAKAQEQANQFSQQNIQLNDQKRILEREKATAEQNAQDLRRSNTKAMALLTKLGAVDKLNTMPEAGVAPHNVEGKITALRSSGRQMELSIGSDDGLATGQELYVFRVQPKAEFIGKVKITSVYPDKATAEVIGRTVDGKRILEGDIVSTTFNAQ